MPLPPLSFTKSKWLAFFAELTAKIHHHHPAIVIEGCDVVRRVISTRISVGAFLEEGTFLRYLLDVIEGTLRADRRPSPTDVEMLDALLRTLWMILDMSAALIADGDSYYALLVAARCTTILKTLIQMMQNSTRVHFGRASHYMQLVLCMPWSSVWKSPVDLGACSGNVTLQTHIRNLQESADQVVVVLGELLQATDALTVTHADVAIRLAAGKLHGLANLQMQRLRPLVSRLSDAETSLEHNATEPLLPSSRDKFTNEALVAVFESFGACQSHHDFFEAMNRLWCFSTAARDRVCAELSPANFGPLRRFVSKAPRSGIDRVLFESILGWLCAMGSLESFPVDLVDVLLQTASDHLIPIVCVPMLASHGKSVGRQVAPGHAAKDLPAAYMDRASLSTSSVGGGGWASNPLVNSQSVISSQATPNQSVIPSQHHNPHDTQAVAPPISGLLLDVLSFLVFLERSATLERILGWIRSGVLGLLERCVQGAQHLKSVLIDAPTTKDGSLSDEAYLACTMEACRTDGALHAVTACKLLSSIMTDFGEALYESHPAEVGAVVQLLVPNLIQIVVQNPTLSASEPNRSGSILHHVNRCHRAARSTSLGECAAGALDACLSVFVPDDMDNEKLRELLLRVPALNRATHQSVIPHVRAVVFRFLVRLCRTSQNLVLLVREMPSMISNAVHCVLAVNASEPQWECAAAAEWLTAVIRIASEDSGTLERNFDLTQTNLPPRLMQLVTTLPVSYASSALLMLAIALFEQQLRLSEGDSQPHPRAATVLTPIGRKSISLWLVLMETTIHANRSLSRVAQSIIPTRISSRDVHSRAQAVYEDLAAQYAWSASVAKGLTLSMHYDVHFRDQLPDRLVYDLVESFLAAPSPYRLQRMLITRFGVDIAPPTLFHVSYHAAVQSMCHMFDAWVSTNSGGRPLHPFPASLCQAAAALLGDDTVVPNTRVHVAVIVNRALGAPDQTAARASLGEHAGALFRASLTFPLEAPVLAAMRCRLLAEHSAATEAAVASGWFAKSVVEPLQKLAAVVTKRGAQSGIAAVAEMDAALMLMSYAGSVFANAACDGNLFSEPLLEKVAVAWLGLMRAESTQPMALTAMSSFSRSAAGRCVAIMEVMKSGDPSARSCFAFAARWAFPQHETSVSPTRKVSRSRPPPAVLSHVVEGLITAVTMEPEPFVRCLLKIRCMDSIGAALVHADRQHETPPLSSIKLVAAASFAAEAQVWLAGSPECLTAVISLAAEHAASEMGVSALLSLRNLCFNSGLKVQLCQDMRIMNVFRNALLTQKYAIATDARGIPSITGSATQQAPLELLSPSIYVLQSQELAARSFWALACGSERCRAYVRGVLNVNPRWSGNPKSKSGSDNFEVPEIAFSGPELEPFQRLMTECLDALTRLQVVKIAP